MDPRDDVRPPDATSEDALVGRVLSGRYRIDALVARGGMGAVYRGEHVLMRKRIAIKLLLPHAAALPELVARFEREAIAGAHVRHPNVASASDFGREEDGTHFLVLEYVRGTPLHELIARGPLELGRALAIARDVAAALEAVHDKQIVHRDVKPRNVIVTADGAGAAKLLDFGFAKVPDGRLSVAGSNETPPPSAPPLTAMGRVLGTMAYMAPEHALGMDAVDARADLYALGVMLYEMLSGKHPFDETEPAELFAAHRFKPPPPLAARAPGVAVPPAVEAIAMRLLEKRRDKRFQSASEVVDALSAVMDQLALPIAPLPASTPPSGAPPGPRGTAPLAPREEPNAEADVAPAAAEQPSPMPASRPAVGPQGTQIMQSPAVVPGGPRIALRGGRADARGKALALSRRAAELGRRAVALLGPLGERARRSPAIPIGIAVVALTAGMLGVLVLRGHHPTEQAVVDAGAPVVVASASASAPPPREIPIEVDGADVATWRVRLQAAPDAKDWHRGAAAIVALAKLDPAAFHVYELRTAALSSIVGIAFEGGDVADNVFDTLTNGLGDDGIELLYDVVRSRGGTKAAKRALEVLESPEVSPRLSPGMKLALELRASTCDKKRELFSRAVEEGDAHVLVELQVLREAECARRRDPCCFKDDVELANAIKALKAKLGQ